MAVSVYSYTIYHSPNAYLGTVPLRRAIAELRWAISPFEREELPARAFYAADPTTRDLLDQALFEAAWVEGLDVNEPATIAWAAGRAGLDPEVLMMELAGPGLADGVRTALAEFERLQCPGVPTVVVDGQRFFGKDRVDWIADICRAGG